MPPVPLAPGTGGGRSSDFQLAAGRSAAFFMGRGGTMGGVGF